MEYASEVVNDVVPLYKEKLRTMYGTDTQILHAYGQLIQSRLDMGWIGHMISFMFKQLPGSQKVKIYQMQQEISTVFPKIITRVVRNPTSSSKSQHLPIGLFLPDLPVYKKHKQAIPHIMVNDGLHVQGLVVATTKGRLKKVTIPLDLYFHECWWYYLGHKLDKLDVRPITHDEIFVVDYLAKWIKRGVFSTDDILLLPKARDELLIRPVGLPHNTPHRSIKDIQSASNVSDEVAKTMVDKLHTGKSTQIF
jgi:hypothetical protein